MKWFQLAFSKYAQFHGRSRRKEYWYFALFAVIFNIVLTVLDLVLGTYHEEFGIGILSGLYSLAILVPGIAVSVRRLHDTGRTGWWYLLLLLPVIGAIVLLIFFVQDSEPGTNAYGPNPKTGVADLEDHLVP